MPFKYKSQYKEYQKAYQANYYQKKKSGILARNKNYFMKNPCKRLGYKLKKYDMSIEAYNLMWCLQRGKCAICKKPETRSRNGRAMSMPVDHCHSTGGVRGLVCHRCNSAIGLLNDDTSILKSAITYLGEQGLGL